MEKTKPFMDTGGVSISRGRNQNHLSHYNIVLFVVVVASLSF